METSRITKNNQTVCVNKLKRVRQRMLSNQHVQPTALLALRHFIDQHETCQAFGVFILEAVLQDTEFKLLAEQEQQLVRQLYQICQDYTARSSPALKAGIKLCCEAIAALHPDSKRVWVHATRRKVNQHLLLAAEYCGYIFTKDWPGTWVYEAAIVWVFGYQRYRYVIEPQSSRRLEKIVNYLQSEFCS